MRHGSNLSTAESFSLLTRFVSLRFGCVRDFGGGTCETSRFGGGFLESFHPKLTLYERVSNSRAMSKQTNMDALLQDLSSMGELPKSA
jgi:hypothetical protein